MKTRSVGILLLMIGLVDLMAPCARGATLTTLFSFDGTNGARAIKASGGRIWAQDEASSTVFGMPAAVIRAGLADEILSANEIASRLRRGG